MTKARNLADNALTTVSPTELGYLDGVTSGVQTQLDAKLANALVDAKGDVLTATADNTPARLAVGANDTVLTADSSTATGLKWATPAAGGMTEISTVVPNATSVDFSSIPGTYKQLLLVWHGIKISEDASQFDIRFNSDSTAKYPIKQFNGGSFGTDDSGTNISASNNQGTSNSVFNTGTQGTSYSTTSSGTLLIDNYASATYYKPYYLQFAKAGTNIRWIWGSYISATAITSINIFRVTGTGNLQTITGGYIKLYGVS
jgi:trimeric autotransporter adhesin